MATHGKAREKTINDLRDLVPFSRSGFGMKGYSGKIEISSSSRLDQFYVKAYREAEVVYTVSSYQTIIAWVTADGEVIIPSERYSNTTTQHQNMCAVYLAR